jgi:uncharacterized protein
MKRLLYATFVFITTCASAHAVEVTDLSIPSEAQDPREYAWFWEKKEPKKKFADGKEEGSAEEGVSLPAPKMSQSPHIALLLPLTGEYESAALAIREGFISAYYQNHTTDTQIRIYDTKADKEVVREYQQAINDGASIVVGPLTKKGIETLIDSNKIDNDQPIITLNTVESRNHLPRYLFPFALNPEDEAQRLAEQAWHDGRRSAVALVQDDSYGGRAFQSFQRRFEQLGGRVVDIIYFDPHRALEDPVRYILEVEGEAEHARAMRQIDFVFLVAKPQQARQIPPLMQFYYAQNTPIYAMSSVYSGTPNPALDNDLNGIVFCDSPWIINEAGRDPTLNLMAAQLLSNPAAQERLFALGVDAYAVAAQIGSLRSADQLNVHGVTGQLFMDKSGFVVRNPPCARFNLGVPRGL